MPSTIAPMYSWLEERADRRCPVVAGPALVEQDALDQQRTEDASGQLGEDVDGRVDRIDPPQDRRGEGDDGIEVPAARHPEGDDQPKRTNA